MELTPDQHEHLLFADNALHLCHAKGCKTPVPPRLLMCGKHWRLVPRPLQQAVWRHYRPGQEVDKEPTGAYLDAAQMAIEAVEKRDA
jgi:hypothetical protein